MAHARLLHTPPVRAGRPEGGARAGVCRLPPTVLGQEHVPRGMFVHMRKAVQRVWARTASVPHFHTCPPTSLSLRLPS